MATMIEFPQRVNRISFLGDIHMDTKYGVKSIYQAQKNNSEVIIQVGDFGYTFAEGFLNELNRHCERTNIIMMFVDGNHEDFDWLLAQPVSQDGVRRLRERIWHLPRNFRWSWSGVSFLALGGAHSVDRQWRVPHAEWWPQEHLSYLEMQRAIDDGPVDVMVCHDAPSFAPIPMSDGAWIPDEELKSAKFHRQILEGITIATKPKLIVHGHYHVFYMAKVDTINILGLNCNENPFDQSMYHIDVEQLSANKHDLTI